MANFISWQAVDMSDVVFVDIPAERQVSSNNVTLIDASNTWFFGGNGIIGVSVDGGAVEPAAGDVHTLQARFNDVVVFDLLSMDALVSPVWNAFQAGDDLGMFSWMLSGDDSISGSLQQDRLYGFDGRDRMEGKAGGDILRGGADNDRLAGGAGSDRLEGGRGRDELTGGSGADEFVFNSNPSNSTADTIVDFVRGADLILLENAVFDELHPGSLPATRFASGFNIGPGDSTAGIERGDRILYDRDSGSLYYDSNGSAPGHRVLIATVLDGEGQPVRNLGPSDFLVI